MVLITIVTGDYKPTNITGGGHIVDVNAYLPNIPKWFPCRVSQKSGVLSSLSGCICLNPRGLQDTVINPMPYTSHLWMVYTTHLWLFIMVDFCECVIIGSTTLGTSQRSFYKLVIQTYTSHILWLEYVTTQHATPLDCTGPPGSPGEWWQRWTDFPGPRGQGTSAQYAAISAASVSRGAGAPKVGCSKEFGYGSIPIDTFLVGWTSIYQLFWGSPGVQGFDP